MNTVEGALIVGTVVKWFSGLAKGEKQLEPCGSSERKHNLSYEKPRITIVRGQVEPVVRGRNRIQKYNSE